jgi:hypothetical protein
MAYGVAGFALTKEMAHIAPQDCCWNDLRN